MKLIAGLGNPGSQYAKTRHNVGFQVLDALAKTWRIDWKFKKFKGECLQHDFGDERVVLIKPQTFMNNSGESLQEVLAFYKLSLGDLLVVYDDLDLSLGTLRFAEGGSAGGHNGLKSIISCCGGNNFHRLKVGIGRPENKEDVVNYVLSPFAKSERDVHEKVVVRAGDGLECYLEKGMPRAMNEFNRSIFNLTPE